MWLEKSNFEITISERFQIFRFTKTISLRAFKGAYESKWLVIILEMSKKLPFNKNSWFLFAGWENQNELYFQNDPYVYFEYLKQNEYAPLHEAAYYGKLKKVAEFLKNGKYHVNEKDLNESTPLHDAVTQGKSLKSVKTIDC